MLQQLNSDLDTIQNESVKRKYESLHDGEAPTNATKVNTIEVDYLEQKRVEFSEKLFQKVDERINDLDKFIKEGKSEQTSVPGKSENSEERMIDVMISSMDLESVRNV